MPDMVDFELVSPEKLLFSEKVDMVVIPGTEGNFGVLPHHAPLISTIRPGVIDTYRNGAVFERIFVAGGFADVSETGCTVLAEEAMVVDAIDRLMVERRLAAANDALQEADSPRARRDAEMAVAVAEAMMVALVS
ncbi:MAG: F0F1 ATP synthase subunit epsilon [Alphaproteobacteria bacterium]